GWHGRWRQRLSDVSTPCVRLVPNCRDSSNPRRRRVSDMMEPNASDPADVTPGPSPSDGELVRRTLATDRGAFDQLVRRYQRQAVAVSYRLLGNSHDALEVTQDAFLKAYSSLNTLQKPEAFGG